MYSSTAKKNVYTGISLAIAATLIWSGNFIIARGIIKDIPPVTLAFFRWLSATIIILPFAWKYFTAELNIIKSNFWFLLLTAVTGVSMFNTFVYIAGHYSTAINMALLGTCTSPIMSVIFARIFLKERITWMRIAGMCICIIGVLLLLSKGSLETLLNFSFTKGDWWILAAAFTFAIYNTMVKKKPVAMNSVNFLFVIFGIGTIILLPFYLVELKNSGGFEINLSNLSSILYLGLGASVICFLIWNKAIRNLGTGRTALFGNLIPVFSSIEAVILLHEKITSIHLISFILVAAGLVIANMKSKTESGN
ncbi:MAG TPA: DMT family transporter [Chitinophagaceae bacterium]|nr:DMT family transporter [Chitinophagaceae bacterium]